MKNTLHALFIALFCGLVTFNSNGQAVKVPKTNSLPVYMHYMPWFESPETSGSWGWHWTMNNRNPNNFTDPSTGRRDIASHYYPLIGPYGSSDPDVIEYHLLLMKLSGIDGVMIDWYGVQGSNGDINSLLRNSNALINRTDETGMKFGLILEDRFTGSVENAKANMNYARNNYFNKPEYIRHGADNDPVVGVFGPITFQQPWQWSEILSAAGEPVEFLPLWYESGEAGGNADGEYMWIYQDGMSHYDHVRNYYLNRANQMKTVMGVAYPGFNDFYAQGGAGAGYFNIPHNGGATLDQTLGLANQYRGNMEMLQLATWNDFGEGTMFEPTRETGFSYLVKLQRFTGVPYTENDLKQVHRLFNLRKQYKNDGTKQAKLNEAFNHFVALRLGDAVAALNCVENGSCGNTNNNPTGSGVITFYKDCSFGGSAVILPEGDYTLAQLQAKGISDNDISSIKVTFGYKVTVFVEGNFTGNNQTFNADDNCLVDNGLNDNISSVRIRTDGATNLAGTFYIQNRNSNLYMDVWGAGTADGANIAQGGFNGGANQQYELTHLGDGVYRIIAKHSGKAVDISDISTNDGANVHQWAYVGGNNQKFILKDAGSGFYKLIAKHSGKILEVGGGLQTNGANINQWGNHNGLHAMWKLIPVNVTPPTSITLQAENYNLMSGIDKETTIDVGGGQNIGWVDAGDWLSFYSINFPTSGTYTVEYRVASGVSGGRLSLDFNAGTVQLGALNVPNTGGWQNWTTISHNVNVNAGTYNIGIYAQAGGWNLNWIRITKTGSTSVAKINLFEESDANPGIIGKDVYPNPAKGLVNIGDENFSDSYVRIFNFEGREVKNGFASDLQIDISSLPSGLYTLILINDDKQVTTKLFIE